MEVTFIEITLKVKVNMKGGLVKKEDLIRISEKVLKNKNHC